MPISDEASNEWRLLPMDLLEIQVGQINLLLAMYPDDVVIEENSQKLLNHLQRYTEGSEANSSISQNVSVLLRVPIESNFGHEEALQLDITFPFTDVENENAHEPPPARIRIRQPSWLSRTATAQLMRGVQGEDLFGTIEQVKETAIRQLEASKNSSSLQASHEATAKVPNSFVRVWFYFPSISTRSKRDDFIKYAPSYDLTGFLHAGKPGLLCVEGAPQSIDDYMKFIKTESWGDIPSHHKKVSERHRESIEQRVFSSMTETTDKIGERHGQRANRSDMKAMEEWLIERGLGDAFGKVLM